MRLPRHVPRAATAHLALCTHAVAPSPRSPKRRGTRVSDGGMAWRARTSSNEATTLAKAVHRWQARRARARCASTPARSSCNSPRRHPHSRSRAVSMQPRGRRVSDGRMCRGVHARRCPKPPRLLRPCTDGRPAEHELDAHPRQMPTAASAHAAICTHAVAPSSRRPDADVEKTSEGRRHVMACTHVGVRSHHAR